MAAMFNMMTAGEARYVFALIWLQTWPLLFAILNSAMAYYAKQNGVPVSLSCRRFSSKLGYCDHRGLYCRDDTAFVVGIVKSREQPSPVPTAIFLHRGSVQHRRASGVVDGNYSFANMQMENVSGYSWGTNSTTSFGQMSRQLANGA
ncbi:hypothetical protein BANRA_05220 [Klebsiella pneumoniae]|nr:hypothetical protein BANRA_05220 [Klebsiella pneumoniae]